MGTTPQQSRSALERTEQSGRGLPRISGARPRQSRNALRRAQAAALSRARTPITAATTDRPRISRRVSFASP
eukprot:9469513-Pyramimonas_sp.AAC.1